MADNNTSNAMGQMYITLKYSELEISVPVVIINQLICDVIKVEVLMQVQAQINQSKGTIHWIINPWKYKLFLKVHKDKQLTYTSVVKRPNVAMKKVHTKNNYDNLNTQWTKMLNNLLK